MKKKTNFLLLMATSLFLFSCGGGDNNNAAAEDTTNAKAVADGTADTTRPMIYFGSHLPNKEKGILSGEVIHKDTAKVYIKNYRIENDASSAPLRTASGDPLHGFVIRKGVLDSLLKQKEADGVRIYFAKDPRHGSVAGRYTLVLVATKRDAKEFEHDIDDLYFQHVNPCPEFCPTNINYEQ